MLGSGELVIERNEHAAGKKYGVRRNQPLGLVGHDDRGAITRGESRFFERRRDGLGGFAELPAGEAGLFVIAVRFDQADFAGPVREGFAQRRSQRIEFGQIKHWNGRTQPQRCAERQDYMRNSLQRSALFGVLLTAAPEYAWQVSGNR